MSELQQDEFAGRSEAELVEILIASFHRASLAVGRMSQFYGTSRTKPLLGGRFGHGSFSLGSFTMTSGGLDDTWYFVAHDSGFMVGRGDTRAEAIGHARRTLELASHARLRLAFDEFSKALVEALAADAEQRVLEHRQWFEERERERAAAEPAQRRAAAVKSISRRRRQIFEESAGKCHYCGTVLTLDGLWHVEHKMPKSLGGGNERTNLVASCAPCNFKKRDRTDIEFKAAQATHA